MLKCLGAKDQQKYWRDVNPRQDCVVALNVTDPFALLKKLVTGPVTATGCKSIAPTQRTVFRIDRSEVLVDVRRSYREGVEEKEGGKGGREREREGGGEGSAHACY